MLSARCDLEIDRSSTLSATTNRSRHSPHPAGRLKSSTRTRSGARDCSIGTRARVVFWGLGIGSLKSFSLGLEHAFGSWQTMATAVLVAPSSQLRVDFQVVPGPSHSGTVAATGQRRQRSNATVWRSFAPPPLASCERFEQPEYRSLWISKYRNLSGIRHCNWRLIGLPPVGLCVLRH
jgi:hypothetical protein